MARERVRRRLLRQPPVRAGGFSFSRARVMGVYRGILLAVVAVIVGCIAAHFLHINQPKSLGSNKSDRDQTKIIRYKKCCKSGPLISLTACFEQGGLEYLEKYERATQKYAICKSLADELIAQSIQENNLSDVFITCARFASTLSCFQPFVEENRLCFGNKKQFEWLKKYTDILLKTVRRECAEPKQLSVVLEPAVMKCLLGKKLAVSVMCFAEFDVPKQGMPFDYERALFSYSRRFYDIIIGHDERLCRVLTNKMNCALARVRDCGDPVFRYLAEAVAKTVNSETHCTYDLSGVPFQPDSVGDVSLLRYDYPDYDERVKNLYK